MKHYLIYRLRYFFAVVFVASFIFFVPDGHAATMAERMAGRILLQVQSNGEGWYVHPKELRRYYLGRPNDAFSIMRSTGLGITNADLNRIAVSSSSSVGDTSFAKTLSGRILLQVQSNGEAWYVYPVNLKRYYLGRPTDAFALMRTLGLGISNADLASISISPSSPPLPTGNSAPIGGTSQTVGDTYDSQRTTILNALNAQRSVRNLVPVLLSVMLSTAAQAHADDMKNNGYYALTSPTGVRATDRPSTVGYNAQSLGAWLDAVPNGASEVISQWMTRSPSNFAALGLNADYRELGVGVATINGTPSYVLIFGLSRADYFKSVTAPLADITKIRNDILTRVNQERQVAGLSPVTLNTLLNTAAQGHSDDMLKQSYYGHNSLDGRTPAQRIDAVEYRYKVIGENIAKGQETDKEVMDAWMNSLEHRENILNGKYRDMGVGLSFGKNANGYEIIWVQDFGTLR